MTGKIFSFEEALIMQGVKVHLRLRCLSQRDIFASCLVIITTP
jgi:hypothetical protein